MFRINVDNSSAKFYLLDYSEWCSLALFPLVKKNPATNERETWAYINLDIFETGISNGGKTPLDVNNIPDVEYTSPKDNKAPVTEYQLAVTQRFLKYFGPILKAYEKQAKLEIEQKARIAAERIAAQSELVANAWHGLNNVNAAIRAANDSFQKYQLEANQLLKKLMTLYMKDTVGTGVIEFSGIIDRADTLSKYALNNKGFNHLAQFKTLTIFRDGGR